MRVFAVVNPTAGAGRSGGLWPEIAAKLKAAGHRVSVNYTHGPGHAIDRVATADLEGFDCVAAVGGDGTLFEVVNGLYRRSRSDRLPLCVIPVGTGNAFARDLGLGPGEWRAAIGRLDSGCVRYVDVGRVTAADDVFHFVNIIGAGFPVDAARTAQRLKFLGNGAYTLATLWRVLRLRSWPLRIEVDGELIEEDAVFVEISNTRYTGTHFLIAPDARMDDGLLDVVLLRTLSRSRILRLFPTIYSGKHVRFEEVQTLRARTIRLLAPDGMPLAVDGEFRGRSPATIECLQKDLALLVRRGGRIMPRPRPVVVWSAFLDVELLAADRGLVHQPAFGNGEDGDALVVIGVG
jgi:YegS/Rv2252/BmrU family lipid kinase